MGQVKEYQKRLIVKATGQFLTFDEETEADKIYDAYVKLIELRDSDKSNELASDYIPVWEPFENETVFNLLRIIGDSMKEIKSYNPIDYIDWDALKDQKEVLQSVKHSLSVEEADAIEGVINMIDAIQDYAVDVLEYNENDIFNLNKELIGYQIINEENDCHPKMINTFSVYSKSQAEEMVENSENKDEWNIVPMYEGDIEHPEYMFEGYPEN